MTTADRSSPALEHRKSAGESVVIVSDTMGIYLGNALGLGFWTLLDPAGQPSACAFENEDQARAHVATWIDGGDPEAYRYIIAGNGREATIADLKVAGLDHLLGDMEADALRYTEPVGNA